MMGLFLPIEVAIEEIKILGSFEEMILEEERHKAIAALHEKMERTSYHFLELLSESKEKIARELFLLQANQRFCRHDGLQLFCPRCGEPLYNSQEVNYFCLACDFHLDWYNGQYLRKAFTEGLLA